MNHPPFTDSSTRAAPELACNCSEDLPPQVSPKRQADRINAPDARGLPRAGSTFAPSVIGLTHRPQVIEGPHLRSVEFRSLSKNFDTTTSHRLAPSFFDTRLRRVVAELDQRSPGRGSDGERAGGRFPRPTEQQRKYVREERSRRVSQRELAKRLEVSRWTIQQVDG